MDILLHYLHVNRKVAKFQNDEDKA